MVLEDILGAAFRLTCCSLSVWSAVPPPRFHRTAPLQTNQPLPAAPTAAVMSTQDQQEVVAHCLASGAADYWVKPLRPNEVRVLWTRLWRQVGGPRLPLLSTLSAGQRSKMLCVLQRYQILQSSLVACQLHCRHCCFDLCGRHVHTSLLAHCCARSLRRQGPAKPLDDSSSGNSTDAAAK